MKSVTEGADSKWKVTGPFNVVNKVHVDFTSETGFVVCTIANFAQWLVACVVVEF